MPKKENDTIHCTEKFIAIANANLLTLALFATVITKLTTTKVELTSEKSNVVFLYIFGERL